MITSGMFTSNTPEWGTPQAFFDELDKEFHFDLDVAASDGNHKCAKYYTKETDGLANLSHWGWASLVQSSIRERDRQMGEGLR